MTGVATCINQYVSMKLSVVIPCLNEENTIKQVLEDCIFNVGKKLSDDLYEIVLVDNGSTDRSVEIAKKFNRVRIIHENKKGYGYALHAGILNAQGKYILTADADESYKFSNFPLFFDLLKQEEVDMVLGSRLRGRIEHKAMPFLNRYLGTPTLSFLISKMYGLKTTDCNSGMRMIRKFFYLNLKITEFGMAWASEVLVKSAQSKANYIEVPIDFSRDRRGRPPHLSRWRDGLRHLGVILKNRFFNHDQRRR